MTIVGGGDSGNVQLLQFITEMKQKKQAVEHQKAIALLNSLHPGETLGSVPGALKAYKTATGIEGDPNRVLAEETLTHLLDKNDVTHVHGMNADQLAALAMNRITNAATGTTGRQTMQSFQATGQEATSTARTRAGTAAAAESSIGKAAPAERAKIGERQIYGETGGTTVATEKATVAGATKAGVEADITSAQGDIVKKFYADPENSAWGKSLTGFGIDPTAAAQAFASGQGSLLTGMLDFKQAMATAQEQTKRTGMEITGRLTEALNQGRINTAQKFFEQTGIPVRTSLAIENAIETGGNPFKVSGVTPAQVQMYLKSKELGMSGYIREQAAKDNPRLMLLKNLVENGQKFAKDPKLMTAYNTLAGHTMAELVTEGEMGTQRPKEPGEAQDNWDRQLKLNYNSFSMVGKEVGKFAGLDVLGADVVTETPPVGLRATHEVKTGKKSSDTTGTKTTPPADTSKHGPMFQNPDAAKAVGNVLNMGQDSTLIKR